MSGAFRPTARRRGRIVVGAALVALAVAGNLLVYGELDRSVPVLQVARDVPAGTLVSADDLRVVDADVDATVRTVPAADLPLVVGQHAKVRLVAGSLVVAEALQPEPLVAPGAAVVAVRVPDGALPVGLRERSQVLLVVPTGPSASEVVDGAMAQVLGRVVGLPSAPDSVNGLLSLSVEVEATAAPLVAAASDVAVVLLDPGVDPA